MAIASGALLAAENRFFVKNGRYTTKMDELSDWTPSPTVSLFVTTGGTWLHVRAYTPSKRGMTVLAWRGDGPKVESGHFFKVLSTGQR